ncbi:MAG: ribokinase [Treponema sp.]
MDTQKKNKIFVLGSYAAGMTAACEKFPMTGQTVRGLDFQILYGGKGSNQAVAAARLGGQVTFCTCIGCDSLGDDAVKLFAREGLNTDYIKRTNKSTTGVGIVMLDRKGNNEIVICLGANDMFTEDDVDNLENAIAESDILLIQLEFNLPAIIRAVELAYKHHVKIILNPAPYQQLPDSVLEKVSLMTPNETEAQEMAGTSSFTMTVPGLLFSRYHCPVVVTLGSKGSYIKTTDFEGMVPPYPLDPVDTTGAGDTFNGALAVAVSEGQSLQDAVWFATKAAAISVTKKGVVEAIPTRKEVDDLKEVEK